MRLLLDECVDALAARSPRSLGHDVVLVQAIDPSADDRAVLAIAAGQGRVLATTDLDFGELLVRTGLRGRGVVLLRLEGTPPEQTAARVGAAPAAHDADLSGHLLVVDRHRDRMRRLPPPPIVS